MQRIYPSKILIAGEYTILNGSGALAIPFAKCCMQWQKDTHTRDAELEAFYRFLVADEELCKVLDLAKFQTALQGHWKLSSSIPRGYGLGSSGAVCAAVWDRFQMDAGQSLDQKAIHQVLKKMESYFHGQSSGMDPMVSYYHMPVVFDGQDIRTLEGLNAASFDVFNMYLLDSGISRQTQNGIQWYRKQCEQEAYCQKMATMTLHNKQLIDALLVRDSQQVTKSWEQLSRWSLECYDGLIPSTLRPIWKAGIEQQSFYLKLCGAGGGGYFLVHCVDREAFKRTCSQFQMEYLTIGAA